MVHDKFLEDLRVWSAKCKSLSIINKTAEYLFLMLRHTESIKDGVIDTGSSSASLTSST